MGIRRICLKYLIPLTQFSIDIRHTYVSLRRNRVGCLPFRAFGARHVQIGTWFLAASGSVICYPVRRFLWAYQTECVAALFARDGTNVGITRNGRRYVWIGTRHV